MGYRRGWQMLLRGDAVDAAGWDARYAGSDLVWGTEPNQFVVEELADLAPGRVLDLAAGEGRHAIWLAGKGWQATAVDFSAVAAWRGGKMTATAGGKVEWVVADVRTYQPKPEAFDAVLVAYLHLPPDELAAVLDRAARAVAPGGRLIVVGHDRTNLTEGIGGPQDPEVLYTPEAVGAALTGLTVQRAERVHRTVSTEEGPRQAVDTLVRANRE